MSMIIGIVLVILFFAITYGGKHLSFWGAILFAAVIAFFAYFGLWNLLILLLGAYGVLMVIEKATREKRKAITVSILQKTGKRTGIQVFANGFAALLSIVLYIATEERMFIIVYAVGIGETFTDCIASDIGVLSKCAPRDICTFRRIEPGLSGGISLLGIIASFIAGILFGLLTYLCIRISFYETLIIATFAMLGSIIDSLLGSLIQAKYQCSVCNVHTEKIRHCEALTKHIGGFRKIDNCAVNFLSNSVVCVLCALYLRWGGEYVRLFTGA